MDYAATTPVLPEVLEDMLPFFVECYGNPSGIHGTGREARKAIENARRQTANALGAQSGEIYFTSGGSESDNLAILGTAFAMRDKGKHIITTRIEHPAVIRTCQWLERQGFRITYLKPDSYGIVAPETVDEVIEKETILVSVMTANNEIGTVEPVDEIGKLCRDKNIVFHTDAVQAIGTIPVHVEDLHVDLLSLSAHKFHGPKGAGALFVRRGTRLETQIHGGKQEKGLRAGTENTAGIVGLGRAIEIAEHRREEDAKRISMYRDLLIHEVLNRIPGSQLNGHPEKRLPNHCHFSFSGVEGEALLLRLDMAGVAASGGSACTSGSLEPSHVLEAIGLSDEMIQGSIRLTLGRETTKDEILQVSRLLSEIVTDLRSMRRL